MKPVHFCAVLLTCVLAIGAAAKPPVPAAARLGVKNATILIVRHAEKPDSGIGLSEEGQKRAQAYAQYFQHYECDGKPLKLTLLYPAADGKHSRRSRLTLEPLSKALGLPLKCIYKDEQTSQLVQELQAKGQGQAILIAWHHSEIPNILRSLGVPPLTLLPKGKWPNQQYGWVLELRFDAEGNLMSRRRVEEKPEPLNQ